MLKEVINWIFENAHWLFSGVGVAIFGWIALFFFRRDRMSLSQKIKSGDNATNIQSTREVNVNVEKQRDDAEKD